MIAVTLRQTEQLSEKHITGPACDRPPRPRAASQQHQSAPRSARTGRDRAITLVVGDSPFDDVVVPRGVAEAEVEELAPVQVRRPALPYVRTLTKLARKKRH